MVTRALLILPLLLILATNIHAAGGVKTRRVPASEFGNVVMERYAVKSGVQPVVFEHWVHRAKFTCRLCHVDIGFEMTAGATDVRAVDNMKGYYCGACHNGRMTYADRRIFNSCSTLAEEKGDPRCKRCHNLGPGTNRQQAFAAFSEHLPKERLGNGIDWEKAEDAGLIRPIDFLPGISVKREKLTAQKDFAISAKIEGMPEIVFSHRKHTVWNGCEVCHPDLFLGVRKGATKYSMIDLFDGKYCGVCHDKVAFPQADCQRCHSKPAIPQ